MHRNLYNETLILFYFLEALVCWFAMYREIIWPTEVKMMDPGQKVQALPQSHHLRFSDLMRWQWILFWAQDQGSSPTVINSQGSKQNGWKVQTYMHSLKALQAGLFIRLEMQAKFKSHHPGAATFDMNGDMDMSKSSYQKYIQGY